MSAEFVVHVIDDDVAVRDSIAFLLDVAGIPSRCYESPAPFLAGLSDLAPGCIVTDVRMPEMTGLDLIRRLNELGVDQPVIVITGHADVPLAVEAMKAGVVDFIEKPFMDETLLSAVRQALDQKQKNGLQAGERQTILKRLETLSAREREVLGGLVAGHANKIMAYDLGISPRTVEIYRANVMTKMQASSLSELVRMTLLAQR